MAAVRAVLLAEDLLFGSKVEEMARAAGATVARAATPDEARAAADGAALLICDLTAESFDGAVVARELPESLPKLGFYAHTDDVTRRRALDAGFDVVAPRSRMMREGVELIGGLLGDDAGSVHLRD